MPTPSFPLLDLNDPGGLKTYLNARGWLRAGEAVARVERAGEGNMNLVVRVHTTQRTLILKQSRPWVEKYPQIEAPADRLLVEAAFYRAVQEVPDVAAGMPALLAVDEARRTALLEDLGHVADYTSLYRTRLDDPSPFHVLSRWLGALHNASFPAALRPALANRDMRALNHAHLFVIPLADGNGLPLDDFTPGLQAEADRLKANAPYVAAIHALGDQYLADGPTLLHGDYYPGSWVHTPQGPRVIDPEFCFFGPAEYDVGIMLAHLLLAGYDASFIPDALAPYGRPAGFDATLAHRFAGMEIMRRIIGVAQLPLQRPLETKRALLRRSEQLVLTPESGPLR
jgi:5-methylthioribose kinase